MGQLLTRQATATRLYSDRTSSSSCNFQSKRHRQSRGTLDYLQRDTRSVHWDTTSSQRQKSATARGNKTRARPSEKISGNTGGLQRQGKYRRRSNVTSEKDRPREDHAQHRAQKGGIRNGEAVKSHHHKKQPASKLSSHRSKNQPKKECIVCTDTRALHRFPDRLPTRQCNHDTDVCRRCLRTWIESEFSTKIWNEINCPICAERMQYADIRRFAPEKVFQR